MSKKVVAGRKLKIRASTFNTMLDAAQDFRNRSMDSGATTSRAPSRHGSIIVRNDTGSDCDVFAPIAIHTLLTQPEAGEDHRGYLFSATVPATGYEKKFGILQEPIKSGSCGKAMIVGITPALVSRPVGDTSQTAGMLAGQLYLQTGQDGVQILWEDTFAAAETHLALVSLPSGGGVSDHTFDEADVVATANIALTGVGGTVDGQTLTAGMVVLSTAQTTAADDGLWIVASSAWKKLTPTFQPKMILIKSGSTHSLSLWALTAANTYTQIQLGGSTTVVVDAVAVANVGALSGVATTVDGVALTAGKLVLLTNQSTAAQNGIYKVAAGAWTKLNSAPVFSGGGSIYVNTSWMNITGNTWKAIVGVYG